MEFRNDALGRPLASGKLPLGVERRRQLGVISWPRRYFPRRISFVCERGG